jgi:Fe-S cluster assembly scaffold protein SufB
VKDHSKDGLRTADFWRDKAEQVRNLANELTEPTAKRTMEGVAAMYESMAKRAAQREKTGRRSN